VLVRPHPLNAFSSNGLPEGVVVRPPAEADPLDDEARSHYLDAIAHSAAVTGVLTSGMVEAAIVGRPVHVLLDDRYSDTQQGTLHFRYLLPEHGGMLHVARDYDEHAAQLRRAVAGEVPAETNLGFVESFIRPLGIDRPAALHFVEALEGLPGKRVERATRSRVRRAGARGVAAAGWAVVRMVQIGTKSETSPPRRWNRASRRAMS
jgi:hypothetical protein